MNLPDLEKQCFQKVIEILQAQGILMPTEFEVRQLVLDVYKTLPILLPKAENDQLIDRVTFSISGLGPLEFLLRDDDISEIMVNGYDTIYVEKAGKLQKTNYQFLNEEQLLSVINRIVGKIGKRIDESNPLVDARLLDGSRVNAIISPLTTKGASLTIRKFPKKSFTIKDMLKNESLSHQMAEFLEKSIKDRQNILVSGGTGAGKTSTLNALAGLIRENERIITIEDVAEIRIDHPHLVALESRSSNVEGAGEISIRRLLKNALRMRPDRIVVGEIRGGEAFDMLQAMNTGHKGSLTTVHANAPLESLFRVESMVLMGGMDIPLIAIRSQVIQAIDLIVQQERLPDGSRKIVHIAEVTKNLGSQEYKVKTLFKYNKSKKCFH